MRTPSSNDSSGPNESLKYWVELAKWFMVSVVIVVATLIIDSGFKDRAAGVVEINAYDKYVTDLVVLNENVGPRRLLAQYFANVTASDKLRERWEAYYQKLDSEYRTLAERDAAAATELNRLALKEVLSTEDSLLRVKLNVDRAVYGQQLYSRVAQPADLIARSATTISLAREGKDAVARHDIDAAIAAYTDAARGGNAKYYQVVDYLMLNRDRITGRDSVRIWRKVDELLNGGIDQTPNSDLFR